MPDRIIRDELLESDRWLDLPTDAARLAFVGFVLIADDFGNFEGGPRRLFRMLHRYTQIKTEAAAIETIGALIECDLLRRYEIEGREFYHVPRFQGNRQYMTRRVPASPWDDPHAILGKDKRIYNRGLAKNIPVTLPECSGDVLQGVGVGVGEKPISKPSPDPLNKATWDAYCAAYANRYGVAPVRNASVNTCIANFVKRLGNEAPEVARFFLTHNEPFYIKKQHSIRQLLADCEGLRTQWKRGRKVTGLEARSAEKQDAVLEQIKRLNGDT